MKINFKITTLLILFIILTSACNVCFLFNHYAYRFHKQKDKYESGNIKKIDTSIFSHTPFPYYHGKSSQKYIEYFENNKVKESGDLKFKNFFNCSSLQIDSPCNGEIKIFDIKGTLVKQIIYNDGVKTEK